MFVYVQPEQMNRGLATQALKRIRGSEGLNRSATVNLGTTRQTNMSHEREQRMMSIAHAKTACAFIGHARHKTVVPRSREEHVYPTKRSLIDPDKSRQQAGETVSNQVRQVHQLLSPFRKADCRLASIRYFSIEIEASIPSSPGNTRSPGQGSRCNTDLPPHERQAISHRTEQHRSRRNPVRFQHSRNSAPDTRR